MTQNKFWLVWTPHDKEPPKKRFESQEEAINEAKKIAEIYTNLDVFVVEATHYFKSEVNIIETDLTVTPKMTL